MSASAARRAASVVATAIAVLVLAWTVVTATRPTPDERRRRSTGRRFRGRGGVVRTDGGAAGGDRGSGGAAHQVAGADEDRRGGGGARARLGRRARRRSCRGRLGAGHRRRPRRPVRVSVDDPLRRQAVPRQLPGAAPLASCLLGRRKDVGGATTALRVQGSWQYDPVVEVVPSTGAVDAAYLNGFNARFTSTADHGATWSAPAKDVRQRLVERQAGARRER
jgi:hypothetical protein